MICINEGNLVIDNQIVEIDFLVFQKEISRGANGIVFLAIDSILHRKVAFKIWLKLNADDIRDKKKQGLYESRKLWLAKETTGNWHDEKLDNPYFIADKSDILQVTDRIVGQIYYAGSYKEYFYTVMEFIEGITLKDFLKKDVSSLGIITDDKLKIEKDTKKIPFGVKSNIALKLVRYNHIFLSNNIIHGDLHEKNIMIVNFKRQRPYGSTKFNHTYDIKIIDFGTSYFSEEEVGLDRTLKKLTETIDKCIYPFKLKNIKANEFPENTTDINGMKRWIEDQLFALRAGFFELGQEYVGWPLYRAFGTYELTTKGFGIETKYIKDLIKKQVEKKIITLSNEFLGESEDWDTFDGRTAVRRD